MCKVHVTEDQSERLQSPTQAETRKLGSSMLSEGVRLSCQARTTGDVTVTVPEDPLKAAIRRRLAEQQEDDEDWLK
jgi:ferredoxin